MHVAIFTEIGVEHPAIPGVGRVAGNLDFLVVKVNGNRDVRKHGDQISATQPYLTVIEAKKASTVRDVSSVTQLIAQLFAIDYTESQASYINPGACFVAN